MTEINYYQGDLVQQAYRETKDTEGSNFQREAWNLGVAIDRANKGYNENGEFGSNDLDKIGSTEGWSEQQRLALELLREGAKYKTQDGQDVARALGAARAALWADDPRFTSKPEYDEKVDHEGMVALQERHTLIDHFDGAQLNNINAMAQKGYLERYGMGTFDVASSIYLAIDPPRP